MNFLPLLMMMNNMKGNTQNSGNNNSIDGMIDNLNKFKQFENMGSSNNMESVMNMLGGGNPEMKNVMQMAQMMSKMPGANNNNGNNNNNNKSNVNNNKENAAAVNADSDNSNNYYMQNNGENTQKKSDGQQTESNPLKPITKIANRDITYMLNRYIND